MVARLQADSRRPERVFWREGSPNTGTMPLSGDPSRKKTRSGRRRSGNGKDVRMYRRVKLLATGLPLLENMLQTINHTG